MDRIGRTTDLPGCLERYNTVLRCRDMVEIHAFLLDTPPKALDWPPTVRVLNPISKLRSYTLYESLSRGGELLTSG